MRFQPSIPKPRSAEGTAWFDLSVVFISILLGLLFLWNPQVWAPNAYLGHDQFGDAGFWWNGALQFSQAIVWENVNIEYRMGYAAFAGLFVSLFGPDFAIFHKFLLLVFLGIATGGYVILYPRIGRIAALALMAALIFSPYQAEWLSTSTSDSLGFIWNLLALFSLFCALDQGIRFRWLAVAGVFLALGGLTRPLMALFIAPAVSIILLHSFGGLRARLLGIVVLITAVALPTICWMVPLYLKNGDYVGAANDGDVIYAASNPKVQVWTPSMLSPVGEAAKARFGLPSVSRAQVSQEYRYQTLVNYRDEWAYHLRRLPRHVLALANFSYHNVNAADRIDQILRLLVRCLLTLTLVIGCLISRRFLNAALAGAVCLLSAWPSTSGWVVVGSTALSMFAARMGAFGLFHRIVAAYWWAGVAALFFTGGTWGLQTVSINALGYRLGLQFLYANEWLVIVAIVAAAGITGFDRRSLIPSSLRPIFADAATPSAILRVAKYSWFTSIALILFGGGAVVGAKGWYVSHSEPVPMPAPNSVVLALCGPNANWRAGGESTAAETAAAVSNLWDEPDRRSEGVHLVTGALGGLIWQLAQEDRTRATFNQQDKYFPFVFKTFQTDVEFAGLIDESTWRFRQGAWLIRAFRERRLSRESVYDESLPKVQAFVPVSSDGQTFDASKMVRFPVAQYASTLAFTERLKATNARIEWKKYPTADLKSRWFLLLPPETAPRPPTSGIEIDVSNAIGQRKLQFEFRVEPLPSTIQTRKNFAIAVESINAAGNRLGLFERNSAAKGTAAEAQADLVSIEVPGDAARVNVTFSGLESMDYVRVTELKLTSTDVQSSISDKYCTPK